LTTTIILCLRWSLLTPPPCWCATCSRNSILPSSAIPLNGCTNGIHHYPAAHAASHTSPPVTDFGATQGGPWPASSYTAPKTTPPSTAPKPNNGRGSWWCQQLCVYELVGSWSAECCSNPFPIKVTRGFILNSLEIGGEISFASPLQVTYRKKKSLFYVPNSTAWLSNTRFCISKTETNL
jgi:hypothetical protein